MTQLDENLRRVRDLLTKELMAIQVAQTEQRVLDQTWRWEVYQLGGRLVTLSIVTADWPFPKGRVITFDVWMPMVHTNRMDDTLEALRLYRDCPTEDTGWLMVLRRLRQKTAAIKDVLLGKPYTDGSAHGRQANGIDSLTYDLGAYDQPGAPCAKSRQTDTHLRPERRAVANLQRWSQVLQLALREEYQEPGQ